MILNLPPFFNKHLSNLKINKEKYENINPTK